MCNNIQTTYSEKNKSLKISTINLLCFYIYAIICKRQEYLLLNFIHLICNKYCLAKAGIKLFLFPEPPTRATVLPLGIFKFTP